MVFNEEWFVYTWLGLIVILAVTPCRFLLYNVYNCQIVWVYV